MKKSLALLAITIAACVALADITYPVDVENTRWAIIDTNTAEIIARNRVWPRTDGGPIVGLASNIVYLLETKDAVPEYDYRVYSLQSVATPNIPSNVMHTAHTAIRHPVAEVKDHIDNREREAYSKLLGDDVSKQDIRNTLLLGAVLNKMMFNQNPPAKVVGMASNYVNEVIYMWQNKDRWIELYEQADNEEDLDMDAGWTEEIE